MFVVVVGGRDRERPCWDICGLIICQIRSEREKKKLIKETSTATTARFPLDEHGRDNIAG